MNLRIRAAAPPSAGTRRVIRHRPGIRPARPGYEAWPSPRMTTTGQAAWCMTLLLTEPIRSEANPPLPRDLDELFRRISRDHLHGDLGRRFADFVRDPLHDFLDRLPNDLGVMRVLGVDMHSSVNAGDRANRVRADRQDC